MHSNRTLALAGALPVIASACVLHTSILPEVRLDGDHPPLVYEGSPVPELPDLSARSPSIWRIGGISAVQVVARVKNDGIRPCGEFDVRTDVYITTADDEDHHVSTVRFHGMQPGEIQSVMVLEIPVEFPVGVGALVTADPRTSARPGGEVWESSETDNESYKHEDFLP